MRGKNLAILAAVTLVVAAAAIWMVVRQPEEADTQIGAKGPLYPTLAQRVNDTAALVVSDAKQTSTIVRRGDGGWVLTEKADHPVREEAVKKAVVGLSDLQILEPRSDNPDLHARMGVADIDKAGSEAVKVQIRDKDGKDLAALLIGKTKASETTLRPAELFVRKAGEPKAWLVSGRIEIKADPMTWLDKETFKIVRGRIMSILIEHPEGPQVEIVRADPKSEAFELKNLPEGKKPKLSDVNGAAGGLEFVSFDDVAKAGSMDMAGAVTTTYRTYDGLVLKIATVKKDGKPWLHFTASVDEAQAAKDLAKDDEKKVMLSKAEVEKEAKSINDRMSPFIHQVPDYRADNYTRSLDDLILKDAS